MISKAKLLNLVTVNLKVDRVTETKANGLCVIGGVTVAVDVQGQGRIILPLCCVVMNQKTFCPNICYIFIILHKTRAPDMDALICIFIQFTRVLYGSF